MMNRTWRLQAGMAFIGMWLTIGSEAGWVKQDMGDPDNSTLFGQARIDDSDSGYTGDGYIERLQYSGRYGGFSTRAPCDFTAFRIRYAAKYDNVVALSIQSSSSPIMDWENTRNLPKTGSWNSWATCTKSSSGYLGKYVHIRGYWKYNAVNVDYIEYLKREYSEPDWVTFNTPTYGRSQTLSWDSVYRESNGYEIEVSRNGGSYTDYDTTSGSTSITIPSSEFNSMGTRRFRVRARTSTRRVAADWAYSSTRTIQKIDQATVSGSLADSTITYGETTTVSASGGSGTGSYAFRQNGGTGNVQFSGSGSSRTISTLQAGTAVIQVQREGDSHYEDSSWVTAGTLTIEKADQAALTLSPTTVQTYDTTRSYTVGGGSGGGSVSDALASGSATRTGTLSYKATSGTGSYVIRIIKAGDVNFLGRTNTFTITLTRASQAALGLSPTTTQPYSESRTFSVSGGSGSGAVSDSLLSGDAIRTGTLTYEATAGTGSYTVRLVKAADSDYLGRTNDFTITLTRAAQPAPGSITSENPTFGSDSVLSWSEVATATNGYRVEMSTDGGSYAFLMNSDPGAASTGITIDSSNFNGMGTRRYRVRARETANYNDGSWRYSSTRTVQKAAQSSVTGTLDDASIPFDSSTSVNASGGSGTGLYEFRQNGGTGGVEFSGSGAARTVTPTAAGTSVIEVRRVGDDNYLDSSWASADTLTITKGTQTALTFSPTNAHTYGASRTYTPGGGTGDGTYSDSLLGGDATRTAAWTYMADAGTGAYTVRVIRAADANYNARTQSFVIALAKAEQTVDFPGGSWTNKTYGDAPFELTASASSGLPVSFESLDADVATVAGDFVTIVGVGTVTLRASQAGDDDYTSTYSDRTLVVAKLNQAALTLSPTNAQLNGTTRTYTVGGGSGTGAITDSLVSGNAARTGTLTYQATNSSGSYVIRVVKAADDEYNAQTNDFTIPLAMYRAIRYPESQWEEVEGMPYARMGAGVATYSNAICNCGGMNYLWGVYRFDGTNWASAANMPSARGQLAAAVYNGLLYTFGGYNGSASPTYRWQFWSFDGTSWSESPPDLAEDDRRVRHGMATLDDSLYVIGGYGPSGLNALDNCWRFDGTSWTQAVSLPARRYGMGCVTHQDRIYVVGGYDENDTVTTNVFSFDGTAWTEAPGLPVALGYLTAASVGTRLFAYGGGDRAFSYDGVSWTEEIQLPGERYRPGGAALDGWVYAVCGGTNTDSGAQTNVYRMHSGVLPTSGSVTGGYEVVISGTDLAASTNLTTTFAAGLGSYGNMFDIEPKRDLSLTGMDLSLRNAGTDYTAEVYYREGTSFGHEDSADGWVLLGSNTVTSAGEGNPAHLDLGGNGKLFEADETYGVYVHLATAVGAYDLRYTSGSNSYENADVILRSNCGKSTPAFTGSTTSNRIWNGTLYTCSDITNVTLCGAPAAILSQSPTEVVVTAGRAGDGAAGLGDVQVFSEVYGEVSAIDAFEYLPLSDGVAEITSVSPTSGVWQGGYEVQISGTNLAAVRDLTTLYSCDYTQYGNMFDIQPRHNLSLTGMDLNLESTGTTRTIVAYYRDGTSYGYESSSSGWTLLASNTVVSAGADNPTYLDLGGNGVIFEADETYGIYVYSLEGDFRYTDGSNSCENSDLRFIPICAKGSPLFTGTTWSPRTWNGTLYYLGGDVAVTLAGVSSAVISESSTQVVVQAGAAATLGIGDVVLNSSYGEVTVTNGFEYLRSLQDALLFSPSSPQTNGTTRALSTSGGSGTGTVSYAVLSGPGEIVCETNLKATNGTGTIQVLATKAQDSLHYAASVTAEVETAKSTASVILTNLNQIYDGSARSATARTVPAGLTVDLTYDGSATAPTAAGTYAVTGTVNDACWQGNATGTLVVARGAATVTLSDLSHTYDGTAKQPTCQTDPSGLSVDLTYDGFTWAPTNAGTYAVTGTVSDANWEDSAAGTLTIAQAGLTVSGASGDNKVYDGVTAAAITGGALVGVVGGDTVTLLNASTGSFAQATVDADIAIASSMTLGGADASNYTITQPTLSADITARELAVTGAVVQAKAYDGTVDAVVEFGAAGLSGVVVGDEAGLTLVTSNASASFASADVGTHAVTVSDIELSGAKEPNYTLTALVLTGRVYRIDPSSGPLAGGNSVTVTNGHSGAVTNVLVGSTGVAPTASGNDWLTLTMPSAVATGLVDIVVQTEANGDFTLPDAYTYNQAGAIAGVDPSSGSWTGGVEVVINGTNLADPADPSDVSVVTLCGASAASIVSCSATQIVIAAGVSAAGAGSGDVRVFSDAFGETVLSNAFEYLREERPAPSFTPDSPQTFATTNALTLEETCGTGAVSFAVVSGPGQVVGGDSLAVTGGVGTIVIRATQEQDDFYFQTSVTGTVEAAKAAASVTLVDLAQVYDGTAKQPTADTTPSGLTVDFTFDGNAWAPTNVGGYVVTGVVNDADWEGSAVDIFVITKGSATIFLQSLSQTYDGTAKSVTATTMPSGLTVEFTYDGASDAPTNAGSFSVVATVDDTLWQGSATGTLVVAQAEQAALVFAPTSPQAYGTTNVLSASGGSGVGGFTFEVLSGPGLLIDGTNLLVQAGTGTVVLRATKSADNDYLAASVTAEVVCAAAAQVIDFAAIPDQTATNTVTLSATASSGLAVDFAVRSGPAEITDLTELSFTGAGPVSVVASQAGDEQWASASATNTFNVSKAAATVTLSDLTQSYDGSPKSPTCQTDPSGLPVELTFDGSATVPTDPGEYAVTGTVVHALYAGEATNTFTISDMPRMSLFSGTNEVPDNAAPSVSLSTDFGTVATNESASVLLSITNRGTLAVLITNTTNSGSGGAWLSVSNLPERVDSGSVSNFTVHWAPEALGAHAPVLTIENNSMIPAFRINFAGSGVEPGEIGLTAARLSFAAVWGGTNPAGQSFVLTNKGAAAFAWTNAVTYAPEGSGWLALLPTNGVQGTNTATEITAEVNLGALDTGVYLATNTVVSPTALNSPVDMVFEFTIAQATQSVAFANPGSQITTGILHLAATASSGLPVNFAVASGAASLSEGTNLTFVSAGTVSIVAAQTGSVNYAAAPAVTQIFDVVREQNELTFTPSTPQTYATTQSLSAVGSGTGVVSFAVLSGSGTMVDDTNLVVNSGTGSVVVRALKASDAMYASAVSLATVTCAKAAQSIDFPQPSNTTANGATDLEATTTSGLTVEYSVVSGPGALIGESLLTYTSTGAVVIAADQPGDLDYAAAVTVMRTVVVGRAEADIELDDLTQTYDGSAKPVGVWTYPGDLDVTVTYDGNAWPPTNAGSYAVAAMVNDPEYSGATNDTLDIQKADQVILNFIPTNGSIFLTTNVVGLSASASSGLPVSFVTNGGPAEIFGDTNLAFLTYGIADIVATQSGDDNWSPAALTNTYTIHGIPVVGPVTLWRITNQILKVSDLMLLTNSVDPEGSSLSIVWVSPASTNEGTVSLSGRWTTYLPPAGDDSPDSFTFRVQNEYGGEADGQAEVLLYVPVGDDGLSLNISSINPSGSDILVRFIGIPGRSYTVQATTNLVVPAWTNIGSCIIGIEGNVIFTDTNPPVERYYRTTQPE